MSSALQRVEHYEIAAYGTVATFAGLIEEEEIEELLAETLEEEKSADQKPIEVSESVNSEATEQSDQGESSEQEEPVAKNAELPDGEGRENRARQSGVEPIVAVVAVWRFSEFATQPSIFPTTPSASQPLEVVAH